MHLVGWKRLFRVRVVSRVARRFSTVVESWEVQNLHCYRYQSDDNENERPEQHRALIKSCRGSFSKLTTG